jgi:hypothetical protein
MLYLLVYLIYRGLYLLKCYRPGDTSSISNRTVKTRPWQTSQRYGTSGTIGWGVAKLYS